MWVDAGAFIIRLVQYVNINFKLRQLVIIHVQYLLLVYYGPKPIPVGIPVSLSYKRLFRPLCSHGEESLSNSLCLSLD